MKCDTKISSSVFQGSVLFRSSNTDVIFGTTKIISMLMTAAPSTIMMIG